MSAVSIIVVKLLITGRFLYVDCQGGYRYANRRRGMVLMLLLIIINKQVRVLIGDSYIHVP